MNDFKQYLSPNFLLSTADSVWSRDYLLYFSLLLVCAVLGISILFRFKKRAPYYRAFDKRWFWGGLGFGLLGLFLWFSVDQGLPIFGDRVTILLWLVSLVVYIGYLIWYFRGSLQLQKTAFHDKRRKEKYLK